MTKTKHEVHILFLKPVLSSFESELMLRGNAWSLAYLWREHEKYNENSYFCPINIKGIYGLNKSKWTYPDLDSAKQPFAHRVEISVQLFIHLEELPEEDKSSNSTVDSTQRAKWWWFGRNLINCISLSQLEFNAFRRELNLLKKSTELLVSKL